MNDEEVSPPGFEPVPATLEELFLSNKYPDYLGLSYAEHAITKALAKKKSDKKKSGKKKSDKKKSGKTWKYFDIKFSDPEDQNLDFYIMNYSVRKDMSTEFEEELKNYENLDHYIKQFETAVPGGFDG